jgi:hypothetical protein
MRWRATDAALGLLDSHGGPFESAAYRQALVRAVPGTTDLSWGASTADGVAAAVALAGGAPQAMAVPIEGYAAIRSSRPLSAAEAVSFLTSARRARARRLLLRGVGLDGDGMDWSFARAIGTASVVPVEAGSPPSSRYARLARRSVRRAETAGCSVRTTRDGDAFVRLYRDASASWEMRYPEALVLELGRAGVARFDEVLLGERILAGLMTLEAADHWMCWLAAQSTDGRALSASYLAYDKLLADAGASVPCVNLGASAQGTGGAEFKRRLGAQERPVYEWSAASLPARLNDARVRAAPWSRRGA